MLVRGDGLAQTMSTYLLDRIEHDTHITVYPYTVTVACTATASLRQSSSRTA